NHPEKSYWPNFLGKQGFQVSSGPDLRFFKYGFDQVKSKISFCVVEVKRDNENTESCRKKPKLDLQSSSSEDVHGVRVTREEKLKGQHAGELLLDLHRIVEDKFSENCSEYSMPGLIIDGTRVSLSMLVISKEHYEKLKDGNVLEETDEAFIYCSAFYNILLESQRNDLIELFLYLDNMSESFSVFDR
ncbi:Hypothetical predicted protein, partial [Mytilus galloprovincialis]